MSMPNTTFSPPRAVFSFFDKSQNKQKTAVMGQRLWNQLLARNIDFGGYLTEINGLMGSGKTSLMLCLVENILKRHPEEKIFWREPIQNQMQITKLNDINKFQVLSERRHPVKLYTITDDGLQPSDDFRIRYFSGVKQLIHKSKKGMVNVVFFNPLSKWAELLMALRFTGEWESVFIDEMEDVLPARASNKGSDRQWDMNEMVASHAKEIRKNMVNVCYNSQVSSADVDSRFRSKAMMHIFLSGSKADGRNPVSLGAIRGLNVGEGWITFAHSQFGRITYKPFLPCKTKYIIIPEDVDI